MRFKEILEKLKSLNSKYKEKVHKSKPYLKFYTSVAGFGVYIVDGEFIRDKINREFTNFGQHYRFKFIPRNEFWIDNEQTPDEKEFFIDHLLIENYLMKKGYSFDYAIGKADELEKLERKKSLFYQKTFKRIYSKKDLIERTHKKLSKKYSENGLSVYIVDGELIRDKFFIDFTEGGHDKVYHFVPKNEIWLDDDLSKKEMRFVFLHELHERNLMKNKDYDYEKAHRSSSRIEYLARHHPFKLRRLLKDEFKIFVKGK